MAQVRLPRQSPLLSLQNLHSQSSRHHRNSTISFFCSPLSHTLSYTFPIKARNFSCFVVHFSTTTQNPVVQLQSEGETQEQEEFSRTRLIAQNVPWTCTPEDIRSLFEKHGSVLDVELSMYNKTNNRGLAFVTMGSPEEALEALTKLNLSEFEGRVLRLNFAKHRRKKPATSVSPKPAIAFNLFVANLSYEARAKHLREFFSSEGANVVSAEVIFHDNPRKSSGYGFVSFKSKKEAEAALSAFQGKVFMGRPIRVARGRQFVKAQSEEGSKSDDKSIELNSGSEPVDTSDEV
ncbi:hypothetical protein SLEP1_g20908 [Rubroshorea leprosula]|uniref:RRM domain-containing protein n=1 Tax=Rubroshorea leprosula TaxID=152421 RepID=A0AAV5JG64_9ROSI|nr:hypothetical protein SLEP1_g20908 [Rubroshorea leprosula]